MIDIQYLSIPLNFNINSQEKKEARWIAIEELQELENIEEEIKIKVLTLYQQYKKN